MRKFKPLICPNCQREFTGQRIGAKCQACRHEASKRACKAYYAKNKHKWLDYHTRRKTSDLRAYERERYLRLKVKRLKVRLSEIGVKR